MAKATVSKKHKASLGDLGQDRKVKKVPKDSATIPAKKRKAHQDDEPTTSKPAKSPKTMGKGDSSGVTTSLGTEPSRTSSKPTRSDIIAPETLGKRPKKFKIMEPVDPVPAVDAAVVSEDDDQDSVVDDQTEALLKGFESDGDNADAQNAGGLEPGQQVPKVPTLSNKAKKRMKRLAEAKEAERPGVVYIGRIPHGFYEQEMRAYFEQFGKILKLRLSRNRKTGQSKHHAWIEFESSTVADIVARSMDNYLMFNHLLKVKLVPEEQVPATLFKGANRRFKKVPWNKIEGRKLKQGATEEVWEKRILKEQKRREDKANKLREIGYEFDATPLKSAQGLASKSKALSMQEVDKTKALEGPTKAIPAADDKKPESKLESTADISAEVESCDISSAMNRESKSKKSKKAKNVEPSDVKNEKNEKKRKSTSVSVIGTEILDVDGNVSKKKKIKKMETVA